MVTLTSCTEILVSWDMVPAIDQNGIIIMYNVVDYHFGAVFQPDSVRVPAPQMSIHITLGEFNEYNVSVSAYTSVGEGPYSTGIIIRTLSDGKKHLYLTYQCLSLDCLTVPSLPPESVILSAISATEISVSWMDVAPARDNCTTTTFEVLYQPMEEYDSSPLSLNTSELSFNLTDLHEYANYVIQVRAYRLAGPGPYSNRQTIRTNEAGQ